MKRKTLYFLSLVIAVAALISMQSQGIVGRPGNSPYEPKDTLPVDSTYYLPSAIATGKKAKFPKRAEVAIAYGYAHLHWTDLMDNRFKSERHFQLTDGLKVLQYGNSSFTRTQLSSTAIDSLYAMLGEKKNFVDNGESGCFFPRHTFLFCNAQMQVTGQLEVCLQCDQLYSTPFPVSRAFSLGGLSREGKVAMKAFCEHIGLTTDFKR
jgi:hypothetical protein